MYKKNTTSAYFAKCLIDDEEYIDDAEILSDVLSVVRRITGAE